MVESLATFAALMYINQLQNISDAELSMVNSDYTIQKEIFYDNLITSNKEGYQILTEATNGDEDYRSSLEYSSFYIFIFLRFSS